MKPRHIVTTLLVLTVGCAGVFLLLRSHRTTDQEDETDETPAPVVTVQVGKLELRALHEYVTGYGLVGPALATADSAGADAALAAPTTGVVASVNVFEGQKVGEGDLLLTLNSGTITAAAAEDELQRQKRLYAEHNTSLKSLQDAESQVALLRVTSPLAGTVVRVNAKPGASVDPTTMMVEVMDLHRLVVSTAIPGSAAGGLRPGLIEKVQTQPPVPATLAYVSPTVDPADGTVVTRAALPSDCPLRPGESVPVRIVTATRNDCLAAPEASVVTDTDGRSVIALVRGDQAVQTVVQTGFREDGWVEVSAPGLKPGDAVVTVGAYGLPDKVQIQVATSAKASAGSPVQGSGTGQ